MIQPKLIKRRVRLRLKQRNLNLKLSVKTSGRSERIPDASSFSERCILSSSLRSSSRPTSRARTTGFTSSWMSRKRRTSFKSADHSGGRPFNFKETKRLISTTRILRKLPTTAKNMNKRKYFPSRCLPATASFSRVVRWFWSISLTRNNPSTKCGMSSFNWD